MLVHHGPLNQISSMDREEEKKPVVLGSSFALVLREAQRGVRGVNDYEPHTDSSIH